MRSFHGGITKLDNGRWQVRVEFPRDRITGKRRQISKTIRGTRRKAERVKADMLAEAGKVDVTCDATLREYALEEYLPSKEAECKQSTIDGYRCRLENHVLPYLGDIALEDLRTATIRRWLDRLDKSQSVKREAYKILDQVCKHAMYRDMMQSNPCDRIRVPKVKRYEPVVLTAEQTIAYLDHFEGSSIEIAVLLALGCGLRRGEIAALNVSDINWETGAVIVDDSYVTTSKGTIRSTTKNGRARTVHMPESLLARLHKIAPKSGALLQWDGRRYRPHSITEAYERKIQSLPEGLPRIPLKNLRHTSLTLAYDSGARITDVRDRAGHSSEAVTERYYVRPKISRDAEIAQAVDSMLSEHFTKFHKCTEYDYIESDYSNHEIA